MSVRTSKGPASRSRVRRTSLGAIVGVCLMTISAAAEAQTQSERDWQFTASLVHYLTEPQRAVKDSLHRAIAILYDQYAKAGMKAPDVAVAPSWLAPPKPGLSFEE